ncbi:hypothetical protein [Janthinobacterium fluminis]|uniref:Uncharacterized protein n=1 Tax=Janthinobacterium fluminis TaxID=2987524 RepID=A0ABT5JYP6_9BURK|nr:hypothetical protein [Janthinobacterium fluminis]MDC8757315.1 hypothetical protein [Janthinobacterium fluminis]
MKTTLNRVVTATLVALASTVAVAGPAFAAELTPVNVADLYIKTIINHEESSIKLLNEHLRPSRKASGQSGDFASYADLLKADKEYPEGTTKDILALFPAALQPKLKPASMELMASVLAAKNRANCKALSSKQTKESNGMELSVVAFECQVVKVAESWADGVQRIAKSKVGADQGVAEIQKLKKAYDSSVTHTWRSEYSLARDKKNPVWRNDFPREGLDEIWDQM